MVIFNFILYNLIPALLGLGYIYYSYQTHFKTNRMAFNLEAVLMLIGIAIGVTGLFPMWTLLICVIIISFIIQKNMEAKKEETANKE